MRCRSTPGTIARSVDHAIWIVPIVGAPRAAATAHCSRDKHPLRCRRPRWTVNPTNDVAMSAARPTLSIH